MFEWFRGTAPGAVEGINKLTSEFGDMLDAGRNCFDAATSALVGGTDPNVTRRALLATDERINEAEQEIRRRLLIHASVHGATSLPACLVLMTVVKDAERIGEYAKHLCDLASHAKALNHDVANRKELVDLKSHVSAALASVRKVFDTQDEVEARALVHNMIELEDRCEVHVQDLLTRQADHDCPATLVLAYRYLGRVVSHAMNIASSVFMPLDKIDYFDEDPRPPQP